MSYVFSPPPQAHLDVTGSPDRFPVRRVYCIGKNYLAHIHEMGSDERDPPVIFQKPADSVGWRGMEADHPGASAAFTTSDPIVRQALALVEEGKFKEAWVKLEV